MGRRGRCSISQALVLGVTTYHDDDEMFGRRRTEGTPEVDVDGVSRLE
jgi:hypothetical protein